ncbi:4'-phosphopantetheinyl transferase superfamily protein [Chitinophaga sp. MM2321]|uniref:4'-phosphopantetheinyl transferase superfamily protein n=1 Tax=Chitinophaga sp. MM2321 TaxID=3137178 RepID=UPI0032D5688D
MIGNDVVDLQLAATESRWQRKGYLDKVYTPAEQARILADEVPDTVVWLLWSSKEAVYKIVNRATKTKFYAPLKFECTSLEMQGQMIRGTVQYENRQYPFRSEITGACVHTIAVATETLFTKIKTAVVPYNGNDYTEILRRAGILQQHHQLLKSHLGIPYLWDAQHQYESPVSVSHHGRYLGITIPL